MAAMDTRPRLFTVRVDSAPADGGAAPPLAPADAASQSAWQARVDLARRHFEQALAAYHSDLARALPVDESGINASAYPTLQVKGEHGAFAVELGEDLFVELFSLYAEGGWREVEAVTAVVAAWADVAPATLRPDDTGIAAGVDLRHAVPRAGAAFYRQCRRLLAGLVAETMVEVEAELLAEVRRGLGATRGSIDQALERFGFRDVLVRDKNDTDGAPRQVVRMTDTTLSASVHATLEALASARQRMDYATAALAAQRDGAPVGPPAAGTPGSGASHGGRGGSDAVQSAAELEDVLARATTDAIGAAKALQQTAPWALVIAATVTPGLPEDSVVRQLRDTMLALRARCDVMVDGLARQPRFTAATPAQVDAALAAAWPSGLEAAALAQAIADLRRDDFSGLHLACERALVTVYEDAQAPMGLRNLVAGRMLLELLREEAEREERARVAERARRGADQANAAMNLLAFIPLGGLLGVGVRLIAGLGDLALMLAAAAGAVDSGQAIDRREAVQLADQGAGGIAALGDVLAARAALADEVGLAVLTMGLARAGGRVRAVKHGLVARGLLMDLETLMATVDAEPGAP